MTNKPNLFRPEVAAYRRDRLQGSVSIITPMAWQAISLLLIVALILAIIFLSNASYSRVETVSGTVTLDKGVANLVPSRPGRVAELMVHEGQHVRSGSVLMRIRAEEDMIGGDTAPGRMRNALREQDVRLASQGTLLMRAASAEQGRFSETIAGIKAELNSIGAQIKDQRRLVEVAVADFAAVRQVAANGFISRRDLESREATLLSRRQQLAQLEQMRTAKRTAMAEAHRSTAESAAGVEAQIAGMQSSRAALTQKITEVELARGYTLTAPLDGVVTGLTARLGQTVAADQPLLMIVPRRARPRIELYVPTAAAGFMAPGQDVRLAIDAFPYQRFGTVVGSVAQISGAAMVRQGPNGPVPFYLAVVEIPQPWVRAFGRNQRLVPGMTLSARIVTEERSLLEWLFEPIFAVRNR